MILRCRHFGAALCILVSCEDGLDNSKALYLRALSPQENAVYGTQHFIRLDIKAFHKDGSPTDLDSLVWMSDLDGGFYHRLEQLPAEISLRSVGTHHLSFAGYKQSFIAKLDLSVDIIDSSFVRVQTSDSVWTIFDVPADWIISLESGDSNIFIGTLGAGLIAGNGNEWCFFTSENSGLISNDIQCVSYRLGHIYAGDWNSRGVSTYDGTTWSVISMPDSLGDVHSIAFDHDTMWIADHSGRILFFDGLWHAIPSQPVRFPHPGKISFDGNGALWGTSEWGGSFRYDGTTWSLFNTTNVGIGCAYELAIDSRNRVWFGTCHQGLFMFDQGMWTSFTTSNSPLPSNQIHALFADHHDNIWIGTDQGLVKYDHTNWQIWSSTNSPLPDDVITCIVEDEANHIWIGTNHAVTRFRE